MREMRSLYSVEMAQKQITGVRLVLEFWDSKPENCLLKGHNICRHRRKLSWLITGKQQARGSKARNGSVDLPISNRVHVLRFGEAE